MFEDPQSYGHGTGILMDLSNGVTTSPFIIIRQLASSFAFSSVSYKKIPVTLAFAITFMEIYFCAALEGF